MANRIATRARWSNAAFIPALAVIGILALGVIAAAFLAIRAAINAIF